MTCSAAEFHWTEIVACQYGKTLTEKEVNAVDQSTKVNYLKINPVAVARQIDFVFKQLLCKVILNGIHSIGQILSFNDWREFQNRGSEHMPQFI